MGFILLSCSSDFEGVKSMPRSVDVSRVEHECGKVADLFPAMPPHSSASLFLIPKK